MKIVICDYKEVLGSNITHTLSVLEKELPPDVEILIHEFDGDMDKALEALAGAEGLITAYVPVTAELIAALPTLKVISVGATGYNSIDVTAATAFGITVTNVFEYCTEEVADHAMALMLALNKGLKHFGQEIEVQKLWQYDSYPATRRLSSCTLGILGFGRIGRGIAARAKAFGMKVVAYDPYLPEEVFKLAGVENLSIDDVVETADFISLNMLLTEENEGFVNLALFKKMVKCPYLINVSRGQLINEADLVTALDQGLIAGAGLDVLKTESPDLDNHPLLGRENVLLTPHVAFYSEESSLAVQEISAMNLVYYFRNQREKINRPVNDV